MQLNALNLHPFSWSFSQKWEDYGCIVNSIILHLGFELYQEYGQHLKGGATSRCFGHKNHTPGNVLEFFANKQPNPKSV